MEDISNAYGCYAFQTLVEEKYMRNYCPQLKRIKFYKEQEDLRLYF